MDLIAKRDHQIDEWIKEVGKKQVKIVGRGGVGKTVILQQMACKMYEEHDKRSLILTYNQALVADIQRCMVHLGIRDSHYYKTIKVRTVNSFINNLLNKLGFLKYRSRTPESEQGYPYEEISTAKKELLDFLDEGGFKKPERRELIEELEKHERRESIDELEKPERFDFAWDYIFIDEGQDWPQDEIKILQSLYGPENLIIADGIDQFVRPHRADWNPRVFGSDKRNRRLRRCMRMKKNLVTFVSAFAEELGLGESYLKCNEDANGGSIRIYEGDLANRFDKFISKVHQFAKENGNEMVDLLGCVPPSLVQHGTIPPSRPAKLLEKARFEVWDASSARSTTRSNFPDSVEQFRIVQYDSCRGLEGWAVINFALDDLYKWKYQESLKEEFGAGDMLISAEEYAREQAAKWIMIPLTRAMDTLILNISHSDSNFKSQLKNVADRYPDFIEWHKI